jgi:cation transport ATPase
MEFLYRIMVFSFPFVLSMAAFIWLARKVADLKTMVPKILGFITIAAGIFYTGWQFMISYERALKDDSFNFKVIFFNIFFMVAVAILLALGTPEEDSKGEKTI